MKNSMNINKKKTLFNIFASSITIFALFVLWIIISSVKQNNVIYPSINEILSEFFRLFQGDKLKVLGMSFIRLIFSILISFIISFLIIFLYIWKKWTFGIFSPIIKIMRSVPFVSFSIFVLLIFGNDNAPYIIAALVILPIVVDGLKAGIDNIDKSLTDDLALLNGFIKKVFYVYLPILFPAIITLLLQTFGLGFKVMVMGEYLSQTPLSVGTELYNAKSYLEMDVLIAWTIMIVIITGIVEVLVNICGEKHKQNVK